MASVLAAKKKVRPVLERIRNACHRRGANGIRGIGRAFRMMDDNGNGALSPDELREGLENYGVLVDKNDLQNLVAAFDANGDGSVSLTEFLVGIRGEMSERRRAVIERAFAKFDADGSGVIDMVDLAEVYDVDSNPKVRSGEMSKEDAFEKFLATFEDGAADGAVTHEEFMAYYAGVSASIDSDDYFVQMVHTAWRLDTPSHAPAKRRNERAPSPSSYNASYYRKRVPGGTIVKAANPEDPDMLRLLTSVKGVTEVTLPPQPPRRVVGYTGHIKGAQESFGECFSRTEAKSFHGGQTAKLPTPVFKDEAAAFSRKGNAANAHNFKLE